MAKPVLVRMPGGRIADSPAGVLVQVENDPDAELVVRRLDDATLLRSRAVLASLILGPAPEPGGKSDE